MKYTVEKGAERNSWRVLEDGAGIAICTTKPIAVALRSILNQHDTLKAKAELLNDFVKYCDEKTDSPIQKCSLDMCCKINDLIDKAKELK